MRQGSVMPVGRFPLNLGWDQGRALVVRHGDQVTPSRSVVFSGRPKSLRSPRTLRVHKLLKCSWSLKAFTTQHVWRTSRGTGLGHKGQGAAVLAGRPGGLAWGENDWKNGRRVWQSLESGKGHRVWVQMDAPGMGAVCPPQLLYETANHMGCKKEPCHF